MADTPFFTRIVSQGGIVVEEMPKFDLESYIQNYTGPTKYDRLMLIGMSSVPLHADALKAAVVEAKKGKNIERYQEAWGYLRLASPDDPDAVFDKAWEDQTTEDNKATINRYEAEIKVYKNNLVKESIRMAHEEIGRHFEATGDLPQATEAYTLMRPDVSSAKHLVQLGKHLARVGIQRREWATVLAQLSKITGLQDKEEEKLNLPYVRALSGLALLNQEKFDVAAKSFLDVGSGATPSAPGASATAGSATASPAVAAMSMLTEGILTANDVAVYGGLLALATMDRDELQKRVLDNNSFRAFLELEPHVRRAISQFINGRFKACLATLASYYADWKLDLFLHKFIDDIMAQIRRKCITSYLEPFSIALLDNIEDAFSAPGESIQQELISMIKKGYLNARIDSIARLVRMKKEASRAKMQREAAELMSKFAIDSIDRMRRTNIIAAGLEARAAKTALSSETGSSWDSNIMT